VGNGCEGEVGGAAKYLSLSAPSFAPGNGLVLCRAFPIS